VTIRTLLAALAAAATAATAAPADTAPTAPATPVVREARYRLSAAVRPLLIFWIRADNVGGARILWRADGDGRRGYELLLGSDPRRAPRRINRWGWEREDAGPEGALLQGLMRKSDEDSLAEARQTLSSEGKGGYQFKAIRSRFAAGEVRASNTVFRVTRDYGYRDLAEVLAAVEPNAVGPPRLREGRVPPGTAPGFLFAAAQLIEDAIAAATATPPRLLANRSVTFTFNAALYDLRLRSSEWLDAARYGGRSFRHLLRLDFEHFNREKKTRERFALACATEGTLRGVPVHVQYQPKWWIRIEGVLDDSERF
jgi:hypothetical protein